MDVKKLFKKKKTISDEMLEMIGMDEEEMARENTSSERKKDIRPQMSQKWETIGKIESAKIDRSGKIITAVGSDLAAVVAVLIPVINYNVQYKRSTDPDDEVQMAMGRSKFSASNQCKKP